MFDIKLIRENLEAVKQGLKAKNAAVDLDALLELDKKRRGAMAVSEELRSQVNAANDEISHDCNELIWREAHCISVV